MSTKHDLWRKPLEDQSSDSLARLSLRLKKLRRERALIERTILALTKLSRSRQVRITRVN